MVALMAGLILPSLSSAQTANEAATSRGDLKSRYQEELDKWMLQAYEGDRDAQFKVGVLFTNDQFNSADFEQAVYWYKQAARQGHSLAQYNLGHQYLTGVGVKRSETEAMKWWLKAAQQDHPLAQFNVGRGYYLGIGLAEDHSQSQYWFKRAAQNQEPKSIEILEQLGWAKPGEYVKSDAPKLPKVKDSTPVAKTADTPTKKAPSPAPKPAPTKTKSSPPNNSATPNKQIALYTDPAKRSVLIGIIDSRESLSVVSRAPEWSVVTNRTGFPVWVSEDFIDASDGTGVVLGTSVNARSVPLIANGTIVGRLKKGETVKVIDQQNDWYRIMSPARFTAWVKTEDLNRTITSANSGQENTNSKPQLSSSSTALRTTFNDTVNDNDWLFSQPANGYTLQLASFDDPLKISTFMSRPAFVDNPDLHRFTSESKGIEWTYFLFGEYANSEDAKRKRDEIKQKLAWVRSFGKLQQNRCLAWKKQIPTPKELNKFCS